MNEIMLSIYEVPEGIYNWRLGKKLADTITRDPIPVPGTLIERDQQIWEVRNIIRVQDVEVLQNWVVLVNWRCEIMED